MIEDLLGELASAPQRRGGILDIPFQRYAADCTSVTVVRLLEAYAKPHRNPTLRAILRDPRFRRWVELSRRTTIHHELEEELAFVRYVTEEEYILDGSDDDDEEKDEPPKAQETLRDWAEKTGVSERLRDPARVLTSRALGALSRIFRFASSYATVGDVLDGTFRGMLELGPTDRKRLADMAEAYVREAGERALAERREEARIAALAHVPTGDAARYLERIDAALARVSAKRADATATQVTFERDPPRMDVHLQWRGSQRGARRAVVSLLLDNWQSATPEAKIDGAKSNTHLVLRAVRRVLVDPKHAAYESLVAHLNQAPWRRVLGALDAVTRSRPLREATVEWRVTARASTGGSRSRAVSEVLVQPRVSESRGAFEVATSESIANGHTWSVSARDEAIAQTLWNPSVIYAYGSRAQEEHRARVFRALGLLASHERVTGRSGERLRVIAGELGIALERSVDVAGSHGDEFGFVFDVAGERLDVSAVRSSLDELGHLIHVDARGGRVLVAHVGTRLAALVSALTTEAALFPEAQARSLAEHVLVAHPDLALRLPAELAGERVVADARPHVRVERLSDTALTFTWRVEPIAGGQRYVPGEGPPELFSNIDGRTVSATRVHEDEVARLEALRARLSVREGQGPLEDTICIGLDEVLAAVEVLRAAVESGEAVVEWPASVPRLVGAASLSKLHVRVSAERDWFGIHGGVDVDGVDVTIADLLAASRARERYVVVGHDKLVAISDELRERLDALDAIARPTKSGVEMVKAAVPAFVEMFSRAQMDAVPAFWSLLDRIDAARLSEPKLPRGFAKILRAYQVDGFRWMSRLAAWGAGACLADEMGLGKTVQTLALLVARRDAGPALVIAPTSVGPNWIAEARRFAPSMNVILYRGAARGDALASLGPGDVLVTSYDIVVRDEAELSKIAFGTLVADEAQAIKNGATARARAVRSLRSDFRLALTGTPVENRLAELFSLMEFLNPGFFGNEDAFRARYVIPIERDKDASRSAALSGAVRPFLLRRKKADVVSELPARTELVRKVEPSAAERKLYEAARRVALEALSDADERSRFTVLAEIMRLRRLACHPKLYVESSPVASSKLEAFLALVAELREGGHRALVFSQFTGHLALVADALRAAKVSFLYLDGKTPVPERTKRVAAFQAGEGELFLISLKAGGTGLNLTGADTVVHLDPWWNPAVEDQATDRAHRIGQTRPVTVVRLIVEGTIEEAVMALHGDKRELAEAILAGTGTSGKLSIGELGALIREGAKTSQA